jgi:hypothetical protein
MVRSGEERHPEFVDIGGCDADSRKDACFVPSADAVNSDSSPAAFEYRQGLVCHWAVSSKIDRKLIFAALVWIQDFTPYFGAIGCVTGWRDRRSTRLIHSDPRLHLTECHLSVIRTGIDNVGQVQSVYGKAIL